MGKSYSLSWLVLCTGATEKVKNPLVVLGIDAAAVVGDLENRKAQLGPAPDRDVTGNARLEIFERVVDQIGENLLQREAIADDGRQRFDANLGLGLGSLMRDGRNNTCDQFAGLDPHRPEVAPPLAGEARRTKKIEMPASTTTKPEPIPVIDAARVWLRSASAVRRAN